MNKNLKLLYIIVVLLIIVVLTIGAIALINGNSKNNQEVYISQNIVEDEESNIQDFELRFLKIEKESNNIVYSPLSIKYGLKMLEEGAEGNTKAQIHELIRDLNITKYNEIDQVLALANRIYVKEQFRNYVKPEFVSRLNENYNADVNYDVFANSGNINDWVKNKTLGLIENLVDDEVVKRAVMFIINVLAIDMNWPSEMKDVVFEFQNVDGKIVKAPGVEKSFYKNRTDFASYKDGEITAISMKLKEYEDTQLEFIAIMTNNDLTSYIQNFNIGKLRKIESKFSNPTTKGIKLRFPKFDFEYELALEESLKKIGITDIFDPIKANLSGITDEDVYVEDAIHKAKISLNEFGIKAAAASAFSINPMSADGGQPEIIEFNKPFMFFIKDSANDEIWFVGAINEL